MLEDEDNLFGAGSRTVDVAAARYHEAERERVLKKPLAQGDGGRAIALLDSRAVCLGLYRTSFSLFLHIPFHRTSAIIYIGVPRLGRT